MKHMLLGTFVVCILFVLIISLFHPTFIPILEQLSIIVIFGNGIYQAASFARKLYRRKKDRHIHDISKRLTDLRTERSSVLIKLPSRIKSIIAYSSLALASAGMVKNSKSKHSETIIGILIGQKANEYVIACLLLFLSLACYVIIHTVLQWQINVFVILFIALLLFTLDMNKRLLECRIKQGFYGTNEYEAREILGFMLSHVDKNNFSGGERLKDILPISTLENISDTEDIPGGEGARG